MGLLNALHVTHHLAPHLEKSGLGELLVQRGTRMLNK